MNHQNYRLNMVYFNPAIQNTQFFFSADQTNQLATLTIMHQNQVFPVTSHRFVIDQLQRGVTVSSNTITQIMQDSINIMNTPLPDFRAPVQTAIKKQLPSHVRVVRYIRPYGKHANMYGTTLVFDLDYENRQVNVGISICNNDNFTKKEGVDRATSGKLNITGLHMPDDIYASNGQDGLVEWFIERSPRENTHNESAVYNIGWAGIQLILDMYSNSKYVQG